MIYFIEYKGMTLSRHMEIKLLTDTMTYVDNLYGEGDNKKLSTYPTPLVGITTLPP